MFWFMFRDSGPLWVTARIAPGGKLRLFIMPAYMAWPQGCNGGYTFVNGQSSWWVSPDHLMLVANGDMRADQAVGGPSW